MRRTYKILLVLCLAAIGWQIARPFFIAEEQQIRSEFREQVSKEFSGLTQRANTRFGLVRLNASQSGAPAIILIHGLDDPGRVWMNLAPELIAHDYSVWQMTYPNDQPIRRSAEQFRQELSQFESSGVSDLTIVAHSMGGLVTREALTNPNWLCEEPQCPLGPLPNIEQLIMVGTPNQGSELARFRGFAEVREQLTRALQGEIYWLDWLTDGAGEAGIDLLPGSDFLQALNQRPHPTQTRYQVIAGVIGEEERRRFKQQLESGKPVDTVSASVAQSLTELTDFLLENLGDGLVTLSATKLEGVPITVVPGNHLSIIRNVSQSSKRVPPAIPIILDQISQRPAPL